MLQNILVHTKNISIYKRVYSNIIPLYRVNLSTGVNTTDTKAKNDGMYISVYVAIHFYSDKCACTYLQKMF